jgi:hypothetical protein
MTISLAKQRLGSARATEQFPSMASATKSRLHGTNHLAKTYSMEEQIKSTHGTNRKIWGTILYDHGTKI